MQFEVLTSGPGGILPAVTGYREMKGEQMKRGRLTVREMHRLLKAGKVKLRSLRSIENRATKGYNKNYIRDWFHWGSFERK